MYCLGIFSPGEAEARQSLWGGYIHGSCSHSDMGGFKQAFLMDRSHRNNMECFRKNPYQIKIKMVYRVKFSYIFEGILREGGENQ